MAGTERYVRNSTADFLVFTKDSETDGIEVRVQDHEVWLTQKKASDNCLMLTAVLLPNICGIFLRKMNYPKVQLVQNLHKLQIMARPITTNSTPCPPLLLLATAPIPPVPHNSVNCATGRPHKRPHGVDLMEECPKWEDSQSRCFCCKKLFAAGRVTRTE